MTNIKITHKLQRWLEVELHLTIFFSQLIEKFHVHNDPLNYVFCLPPGQIMDILELHINLSMFVDCGTKLENSEKTHACTKRTCKLHTERSQAKT